MGRPLYIYRLNEIRHLPVINTRVTVQPDTPGGEPPFVSFTLRIAEPTYQVWLSGDEQTIRIKELNPDNGKWRVVEEYPAR